jgi:TonB family protein
MPPLTEPPAEPPAATEKPAVNLSQYPKEHRHTRRSIAIAVGVHLLVAALVCLITYWLGITTLRDLMEKGGAIAETGAAPEEPMTVELQLEDLTPPPTPNPEFIKEIVKPKVAPPPVVPKKPEPKPNKPTPKYTAPKATGQGISANISAAKLGSSGLPKPSYPQDLYNQHEGGTVGMEVVFGSDGSVASASVSSSSGITELDQSTKNFVYGHWKNASLANSTIHVPIVYDPGTLSVR